MSAVRVGGEWKTPANTYVRVDGAWRTVAVMSARVGGNWLTTTFSAPPAAPIMQHVGTGVFEVSNTLDNVVYTASLDSGSGTASQSIVGGKVRFTLSSVNARFAVSTGWASNAPQSAPDYMERKAYTYHNEYQCWEVTYSGSNLHYVDTGGGTGYWSWDCPGGSGGGGQWGVNVCKRTDCGNVSVKDGAPAGFTDAYGEWGRVA